VGKDGNLFKLYKFRVTTYTPDAEGDYCVTPIQIAPSQLTRVGRFFRGSNLEELPQLINILKKDMSLIGPRRVSVAELDRFGDQRELLLSVQPSLTGMWQVCGRLNTLITKRIRLDLFYITHQSLLLDCQLFFLTIAAVIRPESS
jgi:exopolysaccharide production protein ExoY